MPYYSDTLFLKRLDKVFLLRTLLSCLPQKKRAITYIKLLSSKYFYLKALGGLTNGRKKRVENVFSALF